MTKWDGTHKATRRRLLPAAYGQPCHFCGRPMLPGQHLDLDHHPDGHPEHYRGMSHAWCNRAAGARKGNRSP